MHPHLRFPAPHDGAMAGFATLKLQQEFPGTNSDVGGHQLRPRIRYIDDLATHAGMTVIIDDDSLLRRSAAGVMASLLRHRRRMLDGVAHPYFCAPAPHDLTLARFAAPEFEHEFAGTEKNVGRHELSSCIRHIEDLTSNAAMTVVEDDQSVFQHPTTWITTPLGHALLGRLCVMGHLHCCRPVSTILEIQRPEWLMKHCLRRIRGQI